jgi:hypothetical protein
MPNSNRSLTARLRALSPSFGWRSRSTLLALTSTLALSAVPPALAVSQPAANRGRALGLLSLHGARVGSGRSIEFNYPGRSAGSAAKSSGKTGRTSSTQVNPLTYHGGGVFSSPYRIYDIYWVPPGYGVAAGYQSTIDGFVQNVAADSGKTSNVFYSDTQYADGAGNHVPYAVSFGGSATATDPFPASGCSDSAVPAGPCLADTQVASEIQSVAAAHGWTVGYPNIFVILMPKDVGNCASYSSGGLEGYCSFTKTCAWHHQWGGLYFAVQPYVGNRSGCQTGQSPSGSYDADQAINTMSHELNESVTDPAGGSWYDVNGYENGDKCSWNFAAALGGTSGQLYNQLINGTGYYVQQEWSNQSSKCLLSGT